MIEFTVRRSHFVKGGFFVEDSRARRKTGGTDVPDTAFCEYSTSPSDSVHANKRITNSWQQRVWEGHLFEDPEVRKFFESEGLLFTIWKEMMRRFEKRSSGGKEREKDGAK